MKFWLSFAIVDSLVSRDASKRWAEAHPTPFICDFIFLLFSA
jgi:hypothetical protein